MPSIAKILKRATATCAVMGAVAMGATAHANTLDTTGWLNGSVSMTVHQGSLTQGVSAGGFTGVWHSGTPDVATPITFWCYELTQYFNPGTSYPNYTASPLSGATLIAELFQEAYGAAASSRINSAAFQLAVWELEYDSGSLDVNTGAGFNATGGGADGIAARMQANTWLAGLGSAGTWSITRLSNTVHQDFITGGDLPGACCKRTVPEPPVLPLILVAMGAAALVESRRRLRSRGV
jgi:hypothetical protein